MRIIICITVFLAKAYMGLFPVGGFSLNLSRTGDCLGCSSIWKYVRASRNLRSLTFNKILVYQRVHTYSKKGING